MTKDLPITCIIVDDESSARDVLRIYLTEFIDNVMILDECKSVQDAVKSIRKQKPQLVFLDIGMPHFSGLELPNFFEAQEIDFQIIFTTAYKEYAVEAFRLSAIDYLLKPLNLEDLKEAIKKSRINGSYLTKYKGLKHNLKNDQSKLLHVKVLNEEHLIPVNEIIMLKASGSYTEIYIESEDTYILASRHLKYYEDVLIKFGIFERTHRSYLVNTTKIRRVLKGQKSLKLENNFEAAFKSEWLNPFKQ